MPKIINAWRSPNQRQANCNLANRRCLSSGGRLGGEGSSEIELIYSTPPGNPLNRLTFSKYSNDIIWGMVTPICAELFVSAVICIFLACIYIFPLSLFSLLSLSPFHVNHSWSWWAPRSSLLSLTPPHFLLFAPPPSSAIWLILDFFFERGGGKLQFGNLTQWEREM